MELLHHLPELHFNSSLNQKKLCGILLRTVPVYSVLLYTPYKNILNKNIHRYVAQSGNLFYNDLYTHTMQAIRTAC